MKFYDTISKDSVFHEIDRLCNTTNNSYLLKEKVARTNEALDQYWFLASQSAPQLTFDDTGNTSIPVETQNLVSGTNKYKVTDFTNTVLQIIKVTILTDDAKERDLIYQDFEDIQDFTDTYDTSDTGTPSHWTKVGDYIYVYPTPNYNETNGLRCYANKQLSKLTWVTFTTTNASNRIDSTAHGLSAGNIILLATNNTLPTGYSTDTDYYVAGTVNTDNFQIATAGGGSAVSITNDGTGTHQYVHLTGTPGIISPHHPYLARHAAREFMKEDHPNYVKVERLIARDEMNIQDYWQTAIRPGKTIIETRKRVFK